MFAATQSYIPGLNQRPVTPPSESIAASKIPKEVWKSLDISIIIWIIYHLFIYYFRAAQFYFIALTCIRFSCFNWYAHATVCVVSFFPIQIPRELIDNFRNGSKQPISALNEFCSLKRLVVSYREDAVLTYTFKQTFAYVCNVDGKEYPQGIGSTKKEAKANSARIAFNIILGFDKEEVDEDGRIFFFLK